MLIRTVRMTFAPATLAAFHDLFEASQPYIRAQPGCEHLELWEDARYPNVLTTYSLWTGNEALQAYRQSELFKTTWARTKPMFAAPPEARSQTIVRANVPPAQPGT
ncbi:MAG TPA: antibiotic biosynthesis monooxygenase [Bacteroidetes bacterium]|nr:antibiotic biosynthesis monooxygenase [Bacteroidota bacterium]